MVLNEKLFLKQENAFVKLRVWRVPKSRFFPEGVKYSFALIHTGKRILGYDNERGKGHHKHIYEKEEKISFVSYKELRKEFLEEVNNLQKMLGDTN